MGYCGFCVGDRVICKKAYMNANIVGKSGTVRAIDHLDTCGVEFDEKIGGHNLGGELSSYGHGWWIPASYLEPEQLPVQMPDFNGLF